MPDQDAPPPLAYAAPSTRRPVIQEWDDGVSITFAPRDSFQRYVLLAPYGYAVLFLIAVAFGVVTSIRQVEYPLRLLISIWIVILGLGVLWTIRREVSPIVRRPLARMSLAVHGSVLRIDDEVLNRSYEIDRDALLDIRCRRWMPWPTRGVLQVRIKGGKTIRVLESHNETAKHVQLKRDETYSFVNGFPLADIEETAELLRNRLRINPSFKPSTSSSSSSRQRRVLPPGVSRSKLRTDTEERILRDFELARLKAEQQKVKQKSQQSCGRR